MVQSNDKSITAQLTYAHGWRYRDSKWLRCGLVSLRVRLRVLGFAVLHVYQSMMVYKSEAVRLLCVTAVAWAKIKGQKRYAKTYNSPDSLLVTHEATNGPVSCLSTAERTGSAVCQNPMVVCEGMGSFDVYIGSVH